MKILVFLIFSFMSFVNAAITSLEINGTARIRSESKSNPDFNEAASDYTDSTGSRFRFDIGMNPNDKIKLFIQPQLTKIWGQPEYVPTSTSANTETTTSGGHRDGRLDVHQAFIRYSSDPEWTFTAGRKELNFGDQLLVGGVDWSHVGRSFDLIIGKFKHDLGDIEVFASKVKDNNVSTAGPGDRDFSGAYFSNHLWNHDLDLYAFHSKDGEPSPAPSTLAGGFRAKSVQKSLDYRMEFTHEQVMVGQVTDDQQINFEIGHKFSGSTRLSGEYFYASRNFDQLFPTGHKWLGAADLFSRRNIKGFRAGISSQIIERLTANLQFHKFQRVHSEAPAYRFNGTAYGSGGDEVDIATEYDLILTYALDENLSLEGGTSLVVPESYLKAGGGNDQASFFYLQAAVKF